MTCPECGSALSTEREHGIRIGVCDRCRGIWFGRGELEAWWRATGASGPPPDLTRTAEEGGAESTTRACPRCLSNTLTVRRVDVFEGGPCSECGGVWLVPAAVEPRPGPGVAPSAPDRAWWSDLVEVALNVLSSFRRLP